MKTDPRKGKPAKNKTVKTSPQKRRRVVASWEAKGRKPRNGDHEFR